MTNKDATKKLKELRTFYGVTLWELSEELGISKTTLWRIENGFGPKPDFEERRRIQRTIVNIAGRKTT